MATFPSYPIRTVNTLNLPPAGERYFRFAARETCLARDEVWMTWLIEHGAKGFIDIPNGRVYDYFIEERSSLRVLKRLAQSMVRDWGAHQRKYQRLRTLLPQLAGALSRVARRGDIKHVLTRLREYLGAAYDYGEYIWGAWAVIYHLEPELARKIPQHMGAILALDRPIAYLQMQRDVHHLSDEKLIRRYSWLNVYNPYDRPLTKRDLQRLRRSTHAADMAKQFKAFDRAKKSFQKLLKTMNNPVLRRKAVIVHTYAFLKTDRVDVWRKMMYEIAPFYSWLAQRAKGSTLRDATNLFSREIVDLMTTGIAPDRQCLRTRSAHRALYYLRKRRITVFDKATQVKKILLLLERTSERTGLLKGIVASPGKARGRARIVTHSLDLRKIKDGDVFVAKYTFPTYTPYMRKCVAIVTDEGGLTGHAAVVAREFGIPCVIGTKVATQVLKDGDMVEVDAKRGIVRKLPLRAEPHTQRGVRGVKGTVKKL